jgi:hypothetical protein
MHEDSQQLADVTTFFFHEPVEENCARVSTMCGAAAATAAAWDLDTSTAASSSWSSHTIVAINNNQQGSSSASSLNSLGPQMEKKSWTEG